MAKLRSISDHSPVFAPSNDFVGQANLTHDLYLKLTEKAARDYKGFWSELAKQYLSWQKIFTDVLDETDAPCYKWFSDGKLSVSYNCLDRNVAKHPHKVAIIFESDSGAIKTVTYKELLLQVCKFANALKSLGIKNGDRVIIYMPHSIEAIIAMHACIRIGAIHSVVFAGFSAKALAERITDANAECIITVDGQVRGGKVNLLKNEVDDALSILNDQSIVKNVIVYKNSGCHCTFNPERDIWWHNIINTQSDACPAEIVDSEHPLFILYTSGSTGTPKGVQHSSAGYLLGAILSMTWVFDIKADDIFWCTADIGWITGHTYVCYGPLAVGATQIIFGGVPTYPDAGRFWQMIELHKVSIFYTAPTAIRTLIKLGEELPEKYELSSLRLLGSVGEPINPEAWLWFYNVVGRGRCPIVDTWWQTETGSHMLAPMPGITKMKPGSCAVPLPGIMADIVDEMGNTVTDNSSGYLVLKKPFPSQLRTIWNNRARYISAYYPVEIGGGKFYLAGDSAHKDTDGYFWILGRTDDIINVSGHRLSTMEIESALVMHPSVAEAAVVGRPHEIKGESIVAFVVCKGKFCPVKSQARGLEDELQQWIAKEIGPLAKPEEIRFVDNLPKTRSGKIMRRLLRSIAKNEEITQDTSTLEDVTILEQLKK